MAPVNLRHAFHTEIALGYHVHFHLCRTNAIAPSDHLSKHPVTREIAVARYKEVTEIGTAHNAAVSGQNGGEETLHLLHGIGDEHTQEVVAIAQSQTDSGSDGIDIFQHGSIFYSYHILRRGDAYVVVAQTMCKDGGAVHARTADGEVGEASKGYFLGVARTSDNEQIDAKFYSREEVRELLETEEFSSRAQMAAYFFTINGA